MWTFHFIYLLYSYIYIYNVSIAYVIDLVRMFRYDWSLCWCVANGLTPLTLGRINTFWWQSATCRWYIYCNSGGPDVTDLTIGGCLLPNLGKPILETLPCRVCVLVFVSSTSVCQETILLFLDRVSCFFIQHLNVITNSCILLSLFLSLTLPFVRTFICTDIKFDLPKIWNDWKEWSQCKLDIAFH